MDLGIGNKLAFICASSQGLGLACAQALAAEGVHVTLNGRNEAKLQQAAQRLREQNPTAQVSYICADLTSATGRDTILSALPQIDILVTNNAGPQPGALADWQAAALREAMEANFIPAIQLIRAWLPAMQARRFGRIINITSAMVKTPHYMMGLSTSARAALTAMCKAISQEVVRDNVTINNLLPERIDTPRQEFMLQRLIAKEGISREQARERNVQSIAARRYGTPEEFGAACAFLCSQQAGFISGQNLQLDGGSYPGLI
ncbi:SDR family oxidoreductase [Pantoea phytobeneficialis]|uniref:3-oxoacyl-ACP reductase n=1 Tax=Pantoea phytobeneficialis TaxID=2052056 RepID=A0AAP9H5E3_9GAMM|nr:SDR family oxidoreductase [Pantoea phytobeneficialis]MDO6405691.1 SDR family oxidoreductase [Pantoea phytobeneficialis]QGR06669.1 3-oxoacyl-ACP reductase [Pantoea phytobeneficialis]